MPKDIMPDFINVAIHRSAQPDEFMASLRRSFERRAIDPKFHYTGAHQAQTWLALHKKYSPYATGLHGGDVYETAFAWAAENLPGSAVQLVSLACGGAGKELRLVKSLRRAGKEILATVSDISVPLVIEGYRTLAGENALSGLQAVAFDLMAPGNLNEILQINVPDKVDLSHPDGQSSDPHPVCDHPLPSEWARDCIVTCFGLMPNVEPLAIGARLASLRCSRGVLLVGGNLVPELNYEQGTRDILGQYDNAETRGWLSLLLADYGFEPGDGEITFRVEPSASLPGLLQIVAQFRLAKARVIEVAGSELKFSAGEKLRLFFSNRYTPALLRQVFEMSKMKILKEWVSADGDEGIIACEIKGG
jgi:hypothetical protein